MGSPETRLIRRKFPQYMTSQDVADQIGKSNSTIRRWRRSGQLVPSNSTMLGSKKVWLYSQADLKVAKLLARGITEVTGAA